MTVGGGATIQLGDDGAATGVIQSIGVVADKGATAIAGINIRQLVDAVVVVIRNEPVRISDRIQIAGGVIGVMVTVPSSARSFLLLRLHFLGVSNEIP